MLNIAVADDEEESVERLRRLLERYFEGKKDAYSLTVFGDGAELTENYRPQYDIIFLDIEMPRMNGMEAARKIRRADCDVVIIFLTRMAQYAIKGYEVEALDFPVKPVSYADFEVKFGRAVRNAASRTDDKIEIRMDGSCMWLPVSQIYYIEVIKHDLIYHTKQGEYRTRGSLGEAESRLSRYGFRLCSRYCLVNMRHVLGVYDWYILVGEDKIEVSRRKRREIMLALMDRYERGEGV